MEKMQKDWQLYVKKILFEELYNRNLDEKVTNFLEKYSLLEVNVVNKDPDKFEIEIVFCQEDEIVEMNARFELTEYFFYWIIPNEFDFRQLERILDEFEFPGYFVDKEL